MAIYYTDFSEYTVGQEPVDWLTLWTQTDTTWAARNPTGASGDSLLERTGTATTISGHVWTDPGTPADTEVLARFRISSVAAQLDFLCTRASGTTDADANNYSAIWLAGTLYLCVRTNGVVGVIASMSFSMSASTLYWARLRSEGTTHSLSVWPDGDAEPAAFMLTGTDSTHASGYAGVMSRQDYTYEFGRVSIATSGESAVEGPQGRRLNAKLLITR